jgi:hypothetical protein
VSFATIARTRPANNNTHIIAKGHAMKKARAQREIKPSAKPVFTQVMKAVITNAIANDMSKAKSCGAYLGGMRMRFIPSESVSNLIYEQIKRD